MKTLLLLFVLIIAGCSSSDDGSNPSSIKYQIKGTGIVRAVQISINPVGGGTSPKDGSSRERIENISLPFEYTIDPYYPHLIEMFVQFDNDFDLNNVSGIYLVKDGKTVYSDENLDVIIRDRYFFSIRAYYDW